MPLPTPDALADASHRFRGIIEGLCRGIALWAVRERPQAPLAVLTHRRVGRLMARLQAILALVAAGRRPRTYPPRPTRPAPAPSTPVNDNAAEPAPPKTYTRLPRKIGWLMPAGLEVRGAASQLRHWLTDPAVQAVLAEVPQARRPLAAICRMLALPPWPHRPDGPLPPAKPTTRKPRPPKPRRETLAEVRASVWHHRCYETDTGFVRPGRRPWWMPPKNYRRD